MPAGRFGVRAAAIVPAALNRFRVPASVKGIRRGRAIGKDLGDVRRALEGVVVQADEDVVFRNREVGLDEIGLLLDCQLVGGGGVLRCIP